MGPSASGKTEIAKILESNYHLKKVITHTTRSKRVNEKDDVDYHFVSKETFLKMKQNDEFVETTTYNDNFYGTSKKEIGDDKCVVLDPAGAKKFALLFDKNIFIVSLLCDEKIRILRMRYRNDDEEKITSRIASDRITFKDNYSAVANFSILSEELSQFELADIIFHQYQNFLRRKIYIKKSTMDDLDNIIKVIEDVKPQLKLLTKTQWQDNYPNIDTLKNDIDSGCNFSLVDENKIIGVITLKIGQDENYKNIYDGSWIVNDNCYLTIHRLALKQEYQGNHFGNFLMDFAIKYAKMKDVTSIRIDTHRRNYPAQNLINRYAFSKCGTIILNETNESRIAYQKIIKKSTY